MTTATLSRLSSAATLAFVTLLLLPAATLAQGTLFVEGDKVGIGTPTPVFPLHLIKSDGTAKVQVEEKNGTTAVREIFKLVNNGGPFFIFADSNLGQSWSFAMGAVGDFILSHQQQAGVEARLQPDGDLIIAGSLTQNSSRTLKEGIEPVEPAAVLTRVLELPIAEWTYTADKQQARHLGPMAEDFHAAFGLGSGNKGLAPGDTGGVALAAIQGLHQLLEEKEAEIGAQRAAIAALEARLASLEAAAADR